MVLRLRSNRSRQRAAATPAPPQSQRGCVLRAGRRSPQPVLPLRAATCTAGEPSRQAADNALRPTLRSDLSAARAGLPSESILRSSTGVFLKFRGSRLARFACGGGSGARSM
eukprot:352281-Chlamydomonas_euryale.AAC.9